MQQNVVFFNKVDFFLCICYNIHMKTIRENYNYRLILQMIVANSGMTRAQLARETNLNRSTITYVVNYFMENNLVFETEEKVLTGGRASNLIKFNYNICEIMLIDLQKDKQKIIVCDLEGRLIDRFDFPVNHTDSDILPQLQSNAKTVLNKYPNIKSCGLAIHGIVSSIRKQIHSPFYDHSYNQLEMILANLGLTAYIENEANIYTNGIFHTVTSPSANLINIHIKDGIGSGQILSRKLHRGDNGFAGEIGHSISIPNGLQCGCGNKGCLELYCSERAIKKSIEEITEHPFSIDQINYYLASNSKVKELYSNIIQLLAIKLHDIILFSDISTIYITSDLFAEINSFKSDIINSLSINNYIELQINIIHAELSTFTAGFANIIMSQEFGLDN